MCKVHVQTERKKINTTDTLNPLLVSKRVVFPWFRKITI